VSGADEAGFCCAAIAAAQHHGDERLPIIFQPFPDGSRKLASSVCAVRHCRAGAQWLIPLIGGVDMLAAASAWRILEAEHARLRQLLAAIERVLEGDAWQHRGPQLDLLRRLIQEFQDFEIKAHRPKGVVLLGSMRGRLTQADQLLDVLDHESRQCDELLIQASKLLDTLEQDGEVDGGEVTSLLKQHRDLMVRHLDQEDTVLRSYTAQLLTSEEWSAVVSSISSVAHRLKGRGVPTKD
jgi:hemerythrin-like domain-containing protein